MDFDGNEIIDKLNEQYTPEWMDAVIQDNLFNMSVPLMKIKRTTYPGGLWIERGGVQSRPVHYIHAIPIEKEAVEGYMDDEVRFWDYTHNRIIQSVRNLSEKLRRHCFDHNAVGDMQVTPLTHITAHPDALLHTATTTGFDTSDWDDFHKALEAQSFVPVDETGEYTGEKIGVTSIATWHKLQRATPANMLTVNTKLSAMGFDTL